MTWQVRFPVFSFRFREILYSQSSVQSFIKARQNFLDFLQNQL